MNAAATKAEIYEIPTMTAPNFNRQGGLMTVTYFESAAIVSTVEVSQTMPNPASPNLPWIEVSKASMTIASFDAHIKPSIAKLNGKLVKTVDYVATRARVAEKLQTIINTPNRRRPMLVTEHRLNRAVKFLKKINKTKTK
jgi:hypothetical protein